MHFMESHKSSSKYFCSEVHWYSHIHVQRLLVSYSSCFGNSCNDGEQNDCSQTLLIVCSPLPPALSRAAWIVWLRCVFNWLPGERETTEDDRPTHHFPSLCVLVFCFPGWGTRSIKPFSQVALETSNYFKVEKSACWVDRARLQCWAGIFQHTKDIFF